MDGTVRVLHVDDDRAARDRVASALRDVDDRFEVVGERTVEGALARLGNGDIECIVSEVDLPDGDGLSLLADRGRQDDPVPFVLFTASGSEAVAAEAFADGAADYRRKGVGSYTALARWLERELLGGADGRTRLYRTLFANFPEPTIAYALDGGGETVFRAVNDAFEETFAFEEEAVLGERVNDTIVPEDQRDESTEIDRKVESGEMIDREVRRLTASESRIFNLRNIPVSACDDVDGFATYTDITERKLRERELGRYETIVETMPMGVFVVDEAGTIVNANTQAAEMIGYEVEDILDKPFLRLVEQGVVDESVIEEYTQSVSELLSSMYSKDVDVLETDVTRPDGERRSLEVYTSLLPFEESFRGSVQVYHDVTERRQNERELRRQNERLAEFARIVSHDLRNPLNVAKGHLELLERECDSEHANTVAGALERMEALIGETLQLARQGETVTETEPLALGEVTEGCWEMVATEAATLARPDDATVHGDIERVKQLFENLFRNSVEHAGPAVTITVGVLDDGFYVADDGPGIPAEERDQVFEAGYTTSQDGTGFGLPIVAEIVEAHDWSITVTESASGGARFEVTDVDLST